MSVGTGSAVPRLIRPAFLADWIESQRLVEEYVASLGLDLSFQDLGRELDQLQAEYGPPTGDFLLAELDGVRVGCAGLRRFDDGRGEMKRLYTVPAVRGRGRRPGHNGWELTPMRFRRLVGADWRSIRGGSTGCSGRPGRRGMTRPRGGTTGC